MAQIEIDLLVANDTCKVVPPPIRQNAAASHEVVFKANPDANGNVER